MSERATVRPVTLSRLVELTHLCENEQISTSRVESKLGVSHNRARETILEASRLDLISEVSSNDGDNLYSTTDVGVDFLGSIRDKAWNEVSDILRSTSPHYAALLDTLPELEPAQLDAILNQLQENYNQSPYDFNQTSIEVIGDWGERLGVIQRNAFTGSYYTATETKVPPNFQDILLSVFEDLEETAGVNLTQRYLSIPELREYVCERMRTCRSTFDDALQTLASQNVGKIELSGAPIDTGAKNAQLGIKQIDLANTDGLVSTDQSTEAVLRGVEQYGKQYYYLAVHDDNLTYTPKSKQ